MAYEIISNAEVGHWVAEQMGGMYHPKGSEAIGLERNGQLVAGIIYEDFNGASVVCHLAIRGWVTKAFLRAVSVYAFHQLRVHKIIAPANSDNEDAMRMLQKMGFIIEGRIWDAQPNGDIVIHSLTKNRCKYLSPRYQEVQSLVKA